MSAIRPELSFEVTALKKGYQVIQAINHDLRVMILRYIHRQGQTTVMGIYQPMQLDQPVASLHLGVLRRAGLVKAHREGRKIYYSVNYNKVAEVQRLAGNLLEIVPVTMKGKVCQPCTFPLTLK